MMLKGEGRREKGEGRREKGEGRRQGGRKYLNDLM